MLFHEIYGSYFHVVGEILAEAVQHRLTGARINTLVQEKAFAESNLTIPAALEKDWPLLREDLSTPLHRVPAMPLTTLQKRWLKTLLQDGRIRLFAPDPTGLEEVEPLFDWQDVVYYDQYADGDPYEDEQYIKNFRIMMTAMHQCRKVRVTYCWAEGRSRTSVCVPCDMEYSQKDDKFRVIVSTEGNSHTLNMARVAQCVLMEQAERGECPQRRTQQCEVTFHLRDERNALDRAMLHFSHFEKETVRLGDREYQVTLTYDREDETELLIRMLSFGPMVKVVAPERFMGLMRERLGMQNRLTGSSPAPGES